MNPNQPRPKRMKSLRARYAGQTYRATIHRRGANGQWTVEEISCPCSQKAKQDVDVLLDEIDRLTRLTEHLLQHHIPCEECIEYVTPAQ